MHDNEVLTKKQRRKLEKEEKEAERALQLQKKRKQKYLTIALTVFAFAVVGWGLLKLAQPSNVPSLSPENPSISSNGLEVKSNDWTKGNPDSKVTLIEYLDFECEACGAYYPLVSRIVEEYGDKVQFISRYFPLPGHNNGMAAALAVEAAGRQGKYWEMHDLLFEEQQIWGERASADPAIFEEYASQLGLDMERFKKDVDSKEVEDRVTEDLDIGIELGVNSTPSFFLNGEKIQNPRGYDAFKSLLDDALEE